jgi:tetratricopeptide (TPR) repeat protein
MLQPKPISKDAIPAALLKAERYRLLNEPGEAESICLDVLQIDPSNQEALVTLVLALTDQFRDEMASSRNAPARAGELLPRLSDEYDRAYYAGIICERRAKTQLRQGRPGAGSVAYEHFREAKEWYERAEAIRPAGNDDVLLRWNSCARLMTRHPSLRPAPEERYEPYRD